MKKTICFGFVLFWAVTGVFAQKDILTIEDALKISKMKNMDEASSVLRMYGYSKARYNGDYNSNDVESYWYKDCKYGIRSNIDGVDKKSASTVSVLANSKDRALELVVCYKEAKDDCLKQMNNLGYKRVKKGEDGEEYYAKANDTIKVSIQDGVAFTIIESSQKKSFRVSKVIYEDIDESIIREGFKRIKKDKSGCVYTNGTDTLQILIDKSWDGTVFEFEFRLTNWEFMDGYEMEPFEDEEISYLSHEDEDVREVVVVKEEEDVMDEEIVMVPDAMPEFPGGNEALLKYLAENIKYPDLARQNGIIGTVYIGFVVEKDGSIVNVRILRDIGGGCGAEALRVVKAMPKWKPGRVNGRIIRSQFNLPVKFKLKEEPKDKTN